MYLVFDVGGTFIKYAYMSSDGDILKKDKIKTPDPRYSRPADFVETIGTIYDKCTADENVEGIAVAMPGQIDVERGIVYGGGALPYLHEAHVQSMLEERCGGVKVSLENDGKAAALAEVWKGNAADVKDAYVLIFGTGIGGAVIKDRHVHVGKHLLAGEVSFSIDMLKFEDVDKVVPIEGMGVVESFEKVPYFWSSHASTTALCHRYAKLKGLDHEQVTGEMIYRFLDEGDEDAERVLEEMYFNIAKHCLNLYVAFDPEVILIGGGISAEPRFIEGIKKYVERIRVISQIYKDFKIDLCKFRNDSNLFGALFNFKQKYGLE